MKPGLSFVTTRVALAVASICVAALLSSQPAPREQVGPLPGGGFLLNSGWRLRPGGQADPARHASHVHRALARRQVPAGAQRRIPAALHQRDRNRLGARGRAACRCRTAGSGSPSRPRATASTWAAGRSAVGLRIHLRQRHAHARAAPSPSCRRTSAPTADFIGDVAFSPDGRLLYAADLYRDSVVVINPQSGMVIERFKTGRRPYRILFHPDGKSFFVTTGPTARWATTTPPPAARLATVRLGPHPTDMVWRDGRPREAGRGRARLGGAPLRGRRQHQQRLYRRRHRRQGTAAWWRASTSP